MKVLLIDDEPEIRRALRAGLERNGCSVLLAEGGTTGLETAAREAPDLVILDLAMPQPDGFEVCRRLREWSKVPIIVLSARDSEPEKVQALDLGADDYVTKPFGIDELLARMRAAVRRGGITESEHPWVEAGDLRIDFVRRLVTLAGQEVRLTPTEYELLRYLALHAGRVITYHTLLTQVWGAKYGSDTHILRVHIAHLRNKIEPEPGRPRFIHTEPRVGYRFRVDA